MNISDIRSKYPQYNDMSDQQLADALHNKYYSDIHIKDFYSKIGFVTPINQEVNAREGFGARMDREISNIPRQLGLTARYAIEGPAQVAGIVTDPITAGVNKLFGTDLAPAGEAASGLANKLGLPKPEGITENVVGEASKMMAGVAPMIGIPGYAAKGASGATRGALKAMASRPAEQLSAAASGGSAGEYAKQTGGGPLAQGAAAFAGSLTGAGLVGALSKGISVISSVKRSVADIEKSLNETLLKNGVKIGSIPASVRKELVAEIKRAQDTGGIVDEKALKRIADYASIGVKPTKGTITGDPSILTREKNLAKVGAQSTNKSMQELANIQYQNDKLLTQRLSSMGEDVDEVIGGQVIKGVLKAKDAPRKLAVDMAYKAVRDDQGRYAKLNTKFFSEAANNSLDENMLGSSLPDSARNLLNEVSSGKIPLNVNTAVQLDKRLSGMSRTAFKQGNKEAGLAIKQIRDALKITPLEEAGAETMQKYEYARSLAAKRFQAIEDNPAMRAALDDQDPDKFVRNFILGSGRNSSVGKVRALANDLAESEEGTKAARDQIISYLKNKALSGGSEETASFSQAGFNRALKSIGDGKLGSFFTKDEINYLKTIGRVAAYEKTLPVGSAVNTSNTASALTNMLERVAGNKIIRNIPGIQLAEKPLQNWYQSRAAKDAVKPINALVGYDKKPGLSPSVFLPTVVQVGQ